MTQSETPTRAVWWIKRDMRLADNAALTEAVARHREVLPVFCHEPSLAGSPDSSAMHLHARAQALAHLRYRLHAAAADVFCSPGEVVETFRRVREWFPFTHV